MIIDKNTTFKKNQFPKAQQNTIYRNQAPQYKKNHFIDSSNQKEMLNESFQILQERYQNGLISLEEFTKKCNQLNKMRK